MKMHMLSGGLLQMRKHIYLPEAGRDELIELPVSCALLRHPQGNVLFDTGCHPSVADDPEARWGGLAKFMTPLHAPGPGLIGELAIAGLTPHDIDLVVNSHLHCDHCGCNEYFKKATFIIPEAELEAAAGPDPEHRGYFRADWDHPMPIEPLTGERDLFGDGRIVLTPLPGHSPGMTGALVELDRDGTFLLAADSVCVREGFDQDICPKNTWDKDVLLESYQKIRKIEAGGAKVICGHDMPQWRRLKTGADAYE